MDPHAEYRVGFFTGNSEEVSIIDEMSRNLKKAWLFQSERNKFQIKFINNCQKLLRQHVS